MKNKKTFWDYCARFYDLAQLQNSAFNKAVDYVSQGIEPGTSVIELAAGTGEFSLACAKRAKTVVCSDISQSMLAIAKKKARKRLIHNIRFENYDIYEIDEEDKSFDYVLAPQVLHLLDNPQKAALEIQRICAKKIILPQTLLKEVSPFAKFKVRMWKTMGFAPKVHFDLAGYKMFLEEIGFENCSVTCFSGDMPMAVAETSTAR